MEPISLAVGAVIFIAGYVSGRIGRVRRMPRAADPYRCGCTHHLSQHDPATNACNVSINKHDGHGYRPCACKQYVGERPLDLDLLADQARAAQLRTEGTE